MIRLKTASDIELLRESGKRLATILHELTTLVRPGITTGELDREARKRIEALGDRAAFLGYRPDGAPGPYPAALCTSVNEEIVHGIPGDRVLHDGDLVTLDLGLNHRDRFTDMAITVPVGTIKPELKKFIQTCEASLEAGIQAAQPGAKIGDISAAVSKVVKGAGYAVVKELAGHGVGYSVHEDPYVPNYGTAGKGLVLEPGLVIAIEPMIALKGNGDIALEDDGFTFTTRDGSISAHYEHTVLITDSGPEILTRK